MLFILWFNNWRISIFSFGTKLDVKFNLFGISIEISLPSNIFSLFIALLLIILLFSIIGEDDEELTDFFIEEKLSNKASFSLLFWFLLLFSDILLTLEFLWFCSWLLFSKIKRKIIRYILLH